MAEIVRFVDSQLFTKSLSAFFVMALAETCLGTIRLLVLPKVVSKQTQEIIGTTSAIASVLGISYTLIDWIRPVTRGDLAKIGILWYSCMVGFDIAIAKLRGLTMYDVERAFNPAKGGYLGLYMSVLFFAPFIAYDLKYGYGRYGARNGSS